MLLSNYKTPTSCTVDACSAQSIAVEEIERDTPSKQLQSGAPSECPAPVIKLKDQGQERHPSEYSSLSSAKSLGVSSSGTSILGGTAESCVNLSIPNGMAPPKSSSLTSKVNGSFE